MTAEEAIKYLDNVRIDERFGIDSMVKASAIVNTCKEALKKQIPVKPKPLKKRTWDGQIVYDCSVCGGRLGTKRFSIEQKEIGCPRCLQLIDWEGVE